MTSITILANERKITLEAEHGKNPTNSIMDKPQFQYIEINKNV